jgi:hypothetical protein
MQPSMMSWFGGRHLGSLLEQFVEVDSGCGAVHMITQCGALSGMAYMCLENVSHSQLRQSRELSIIHCPISNA